MQKFCAVLVAIVFIATVADAVALKTDASIQRKKKLIQQIKKTAFGRSMLTVVKSQMHAEETAGRRSFYRVQDFLDQIFKRVVNAQVTEQRSHSYNLARCKHALTNMLMAAKRQDEAVKNLTGVVHEERLAIQHASVVIVQSQNGQKEAQTEIAKAQKQLDVFAFDRTNKHELYKRKFAEAREIVMTVRSIINNLQLFFPSTSGPTYNPDKQSAATPEQVREKTVAALARFQELVRTAPNGDDIYTEEDKLRFMELTHLLETSIYATKRVDDIRNMLTMLDAQLRVYMQHMNAAEERSIRHYNMKKAEFEQDRERSEKELALQVNNEKEARATLKANIGLLQDNVQERKLAIQTLSIIKQQLRTMTAHCKAQTAQDQTEESHRIEQIKTLKALRIVAAKHIMHERDAFREKALRQIQMQEAATKLQQKKLREAREALNHITLQLDDSEKNDYNNGQGNSTVTPVKTIDDSIANNTVIGGAARQFMINQMHSMRGVLQIQLKGAVDLVKKDRQASDPFAKVTVGDDTVSTKTIKANLNPEWDFYHEFSVSDASMQSLKIEVWDFDRFMPSNDFEGDMDLNISDLIILSLINRVRGGASSSGHKALNAVLTVQQVEELKKFNIMNDGPYRLNGHWSLKHIEHGKVHLICTFTPKTA